MTESLSIIISNQKSKEIKASIIQKIGFIYFMTERDFFGYPCCPYVKIGLVKGNDNGRSSFERRKEHQTGNPISIRLPSINKKMFRFIYPYLH